MTSKANETKPETGTHMICF